MRYAQSTYCAYLSRKAYISHSAAVRRAAGHTKYTQADAAGGQINSLDLCLFSFY
nr:MAG TPA: hypothetical protein [Caudoviricetes sp.]